MTFPGGLATDRSFDGLCCPVTRSPLEATAGALVSAEGRRYELVEGIPVLLHEDSIFRMESAAAVGAKRASVSAGARVRRMARRVAPSDSRNVRGEANYGRLKCLLDSREGRPRILVVGGGITGRGMDRLAHSPNYDILSTDVYIGPATEIVCDGHWLPFVDQTFDAVVVQAVLEHVLDPPRVVGEIHRVLKDEGLVYSEIPFIQQVHAGAHDFTRYTALGHRRLFRQFEEEWLGAVAGPGMALGWSLRYFLAAFTGRHRRLRAVVMHVTQLVTWWLTILDGRLVGTPGGIDAASVTGFLGRKASEPITDRHLLGRYEGAMSSVEWQV